MYWIKILQTHEFMSSLEKLMSTKLKVVVELQNAL